MPQREQCANKACGDDATEIIEGDAFCGTHADMARESFTWSPMRAAGVRPWSSNAALIDPADAARAERRQRIEG